MKNLFLVLSLIGALHLFLSGTKVHAQLINSSETENVFTEKDAGEVMIEKGKEFQIRLLGCERNQDMNFIGSQDSFGWERQEDDSTTKNVVEEIGLPLVEQAPDPVTKDGLWKVKKNFYEWHFKANELRDVVLAFQKYHYDDLRVRHLDGSPIKTLVETLFFTVHVFQKPTEKPSAPPTGKPIMRPSEQPTEKPSAQLTGSLTTTQR